MEYLPEPTVSVPTSSEGLRARLIQHAYVWKNAVKKAGVSGSFDMQREARLALSNVNHLLDHYPNGVPRDHLVPGAHANPQLAPLPEPVESD